MFRMQNNTVVDLLHPDLLSTTVLQEILVETKIGEEHINGASREQLLSLYSKVILPLPQREFRNNRRGAYLSKKCGRNALQEKSPESQVTVKAKSTSPVPCPETQSRPPTTKNKIVGLHATEPQSRLKPPPISTESGKIIKLNSRATNGDSIISPKRSMSPPGDSKRPKLIRLNRTLPPQNNKSKDDHCEETTDPSPPKKKHKPILWP